MPETHFIAGPFTHTYCPDCADKLRIELFSSQASRSPHDDAQRVQDLIHDLRAAG
ncbi:MAG: hypothetical protein AMXMBFR4_20450 [Candidatus Hydrogenedentota bacterium]